MAINVDEITKDELLDILYEYNLYIQDANEVDRYADGWYPVCINEFYDNEYQVILEEREGD